jgi:NitT/TauT family transport system ATP-binding protein
MPSHGVRPHDPGNSAMSHELAWRELQDGEPHATERLSSSDQASDQTTEALIQIRDVARRFSEGSSGDESVKALENVSLDVSRGSFVALIGPSGCGKSTLLKLVAGLLQASEGELSYGGRPINGPPFDAIYLFQEYSKSLFPWKTVLGNVAFGLQARADLSRDEVKAECRKYLKLVGLPEREDSFPWQLSGGMQQRVAIARALVCSPKVLLMDEPFGSLDALTRSDLQDLLLKLWKNLELTVLFVTHDIEEAIYLSQRVLLMSEAPGKIARDLKIELPYPRDHVSTPEDGRYRDYRRDLMIQLGGGGEDDLAGSA